jgi:hypothetical protein
VTELIIDDFKLGLDVRRSVLTAPAGSLRTLDNFIINAGGEIEKRGAFVAVTNLPAGTLGLIGLMNEIHVFGQIAPPAINQGTSPFPVLYHQLAVDTGKTISRLVDFDAYQQKFMVAALNTDGSYTNWYDGVVVPPNPGSYIRLYGSKMYRLNGTILRFAGVGDPTVQDPANTNNPGAGFIDLADHDSDAENLVAMEVYYKQVAVFSRLMTQLWTLDPDPAADVFQQLVRIGCVAPQSALQFGTGDVLFMSDSGVRSLKAINASMAAAVNDVGSPIDPLIIDEIRNSPYMNQVCAIVQPITGRYWLSVGTKIYVLSYYPSAKISAWATFTLTVPVDYMSTVQNRVIFRSGDTLYMYGGPDGNQYDNTLATVVTPMMAAETPTTWKKPISIDLMINGVWTLQAGMLANNPTARELVGTFAGQTYSLQSIPYAGYGTHIGLTLTTSDPSPAILGSMTINFQKADVK